MYVYDHNHIADGTLDDKSCMDVRPVLLILRLVNPVAFLCMA